MYQNKHSYVDIMSNPENYNVYTSSYFGGGTWYKGKYYDLNLNGEIKYAVLEWNPESRNVWEWHPLCLVEDVCYGIDENGEYIETIIGYDENGNKIEYSSLAINDNVLKISSPDRVVKKGDIIQYRLGNKNDLAEVWLQHDVDNSDYYMPVALEDKVNSTVHKVYGKVRLLAGSCVSLVCDGAVDNSPMDNDFYTVNNGNGIYRFNKETGAIRKISFEEINVDEDVFICANRSNKNRMIVVYE